MSSAGRAATSAGVRFGGLTVSTGTLSGALLTLGAVTTGTTAALAALSTTIFPLIAVAGTLAAGVGSLAAAFGGLAAVGAVTHMEELKTAFGEAKTEIRELIQPLGNVFGPLLVDAVEALPTLVERILEAIGPVDQFRDAMVEYGDLAMDVIPQVAGAMMDLARNALPPLRNLIGYLTDNGGSAFEGMLQVTRELAPELKTFGAAVVNAIPPITKMGTILLNTLLPPLASVIDLITGAVESINEFVTGSEAFQEGAGAIAEILDGTVTEAVEGATELWTTHGDDVLGAVESGYGEVSSIAADRAGAVESGVKSALRSTGRIWKTHGDEIERTARTTFGSVETIVKTSFSEIRETSELEISAVTGVLGTFDEAVKNQLVGPLTDADSDFSETFSSIQTEVEESLGLVEEIITDFVSVAFDSGIQPYIRNASDLWQQHLSGPDGIVANARTAFNTLWRYVIRPTLNTIQGAWELFGNDIITLLRGVFGTLETLYTIKLDAFLTAVNVFLDLLSGDWRGAWNSIAGFLQRTFNEIAEWLKGPAVSLLNGALGLIASAIKAPFLAVYNWLIGNSIVKDMINDSVSWLKQTGKSLIAGAFETVTEGIKNSIAYLTGTGEDSLIGDAKAKLNGLATWVKSTAKEKVKSAFQTISDAITEALEVNIDWPEPPEIVKKAFNGNLDIDWPSPGDGGSSGSDDDDDGTVDLDDPDENITGGTGTEGPDRDDHLEGNDGTSPGYGLDDPREEDERSGNSGPSRDDHISGDDGTGPGYGLSTGGMIEKTGWAKLHAPEMVLSQDQTADVQRGNALAVGDVGSNMEKALQSADRTDDLIAELRSIRHRLGEVAAEAGTEVEFRDEDRWRAVER
ncbi:hypothetical protein [Natrinema amylolyticum]|uniref:hypothetical protein n=1 Tax=Natrinema amylolyticum TaxID=2878679 RepID=UPI001CF98655|nr:hypothetical protein [Natrinema amylolyticum]